MWAAGGREKHKETTNILKAKENKDCIYVKL